ncbi:hypothetical protein FRC00_007943 [Tulasnella sp. 408]|nr:hypothetical protein FRC00_007943 [Tulasnella sp. 408]
MGLDLLDLGNYNDDVGPDSGAKFFGTLKIALPKLMNLQKLEIASWDLIYKSSLPHLPRGCRFPTLQHYSGPPEVLDEMQSNVLKTLFIRSTDISTVPNTLLAAARLSGKTLRTLKIESCSPGVDGEWERLHKDIPSLFPNLRHLALESIHFISSTHLDEQVIPSVRRLPNLRLLRISGFGGDLEEASAIQHLHAACPQLRGIALYDLYRPWRYSEPGRAWLPPPDLGDSDNDNQLWEEADYHKFFEDPYHEGLVYHSILYG